ncbi:hypothetical protein ERO13_A11G044350v2 [Gossypium hirsutum]|uniref:Uncharacterized protein n=3 Tax=Gossypium TaxID=3633 RepID=A0A5J5NAA6_GOSBA|nr:hypothetical protein ES319_1Z064200v1 [Gossypium barbadense]KAG4173208.1 hypothetical protein ERO13_A11G044350v2 [Gossypium hirsutum]TYG92704.1 hypothetical protein ES288_A11G052800v1 [Gossypium darwinii]TYH99244.1 hypothetical protein ES332_A11G053500v1 [Gossypium tomentosum]
MLLGFGCMCRKQVFDFWDLSAAIKVVMHVHLSIPRVLAVGSLTQFSPMLLACAIQISDLLALQGQLTCKF